MQIPSTDCAPSLFHARILSTTNSPTITTLLTPDVAIYSPQSNYRHVLPGRCLSESSTHLWSIQLQHHSSLRSSYFGGKSAPQPNVDNITHKHGRKRTTSHECATYTHAAPPDFRAVAVPGNVNTTTTIPNYADCTHPATSRSISTTAKAVSRWSNIPYQSDPA